MHERNDDFRRRFPGVVWSNRRASDSVQIRAALLRPRFFTLLEIALEFGLERVRAEWKILVEEGTAEALRARSIVERILNNLEKGFAYQQDYLAANEVKVSFFTAGQGLEKILEKKNARAESTRRHLAGIIRKQVPVSAIRSKTRDWLDLYLLLREHGFTFNDYYQAFVKAGLESQFEIAVARICSGVPQRNDEGYEHLISNPPSVEQMKRFFLEQRDTFEVERAAAAKRRAQRCP